ncbi:MAG TPA: acyl-CoA thioesterase domain-containing protein [Mycobacteriales bacterium]|jgi:acyl-CoA thioesterase|nr:acyl-CoA thioesterase domain-containing protein [Mycobacteriales bacterium]
MPDRVDVVDVLALEPNGVDSYRGENLTDSHGVVFGGQLMAQVVTAAGLAVPDKRVKSIHNVFARGGDPERPLDLTVVRQSSGRSFATVAVAVAQDERLCTSALVLMQAAEPDLIRHQAAMPASKGPDLATPKYSSRGWEVRIDDDVDLYDPEAVGPAELNVWSRFSNGPHDPSTSQALLAYASDGFLIGTAMRPHAGVGQSMAHVSISTSVISQTVSFHDDFDAADWHLLAHESPHAGGGRSYGRAHVFTADGRLVASYEQQNLIRAFAADRRPAPGTVSKY